MTIAQKDLVAEVLARVADNMSYCEDTQDYRERSEDWRLCLTIEQSAELYKAIASLNKDLYKAAEKKS